MKYKCYNCGKIFDEEDSGFKRELVGEFWGAPAYESVMVCPECRSDDLDEYTEEEEEEE